MCKKLQNKTTLTQRGFSIAEMSIVIAIIALLVGMVTAGFQVQKSSELRSITTQVDQFKVAIEGFDLKYDALPGDMDDAFDYWGADCAGSAGNCNGDGDGLIESGSTVNDWEIYRFWQHLYLAGFIEGGYTGVRGSNPTDIAGQNVPAGSRSKSLYYANYSSAGGLYQKRNSNVLWYSSLRSGYSPITQGGGILTSAEAYSIDDKIDDGLADDGLVFTIRDSSSTVRDVANACTDNRWDAASGAYSLTTPSNVPERNCRMIFFLDVMK